MRSKEGFTFLEMLMVVLILGVFVAMATPRFRATYVELQLSNQARSLAKFLTYAQERAIVEGKKYRLEMNPAERQYWLTVEETGKEESEPRFARVEGRHGRTFQFPADMSLETETKEILFYPDGNSDSFTLILKNREGGELILKNGKSFGYVRIEEPAAS